MKSPSILVIDDEPNNFDVIEALLSVGVGIHSPISAGDTGCLIEDCHLHYAASGKVAIAALDTFQPDLILLDVMMPGMDGIEVCQRIKADSKWRSVPIVMVTALTAKEDLAKCLQSGADDFISKPVNGLELRARVQSMLRIKKQYDDLQGLLQLREDMVRMIVHDLRNPLTEVLLGLELTQMAKQSPNQQTDRLNKIYTSARSLQSLIDDLLQVALIESNKLRLNCQDTDPCELVRTAIADFEAISQHKNLSLIAQLPEASDRKVSVDADMMHRTLGNLLSNAIKFSPDNQKIIVTVEFPETHQCKIQVIDSGPGVPEALRQKIFDKYEVGNTMPGVSQIGLGLAFCKMVIEAHGGDISVDNNQPQGAIFEILLGAK